MKKRPFYRNIIRNAIHQKEERNSNIHPETVKAQQPKLDSGAGSSKGESHCR